MQIQLKQYYLFLLLPAALIFPFVYLVCETDLIPVEKMVLSSLFYPVFFVAGALCAVAGPIFLRTLFAHRVRNQNRVSKKMFMTFQKRLLFMALITPYLAMAALFFDLPRFYSSAVVLMALYAVYYYYPSMRRVRFDVRIFKVR